jgi:plastocyanin
MDEQKKKRIMIWVAVGVFVALGIIILATSGDKTTTDIKESIIGTNTEETPGVVSTPVPNNAEVPQASAVSREKLPEGTIELSASATGFSPNSFTVDAGQKITLAITSKDKSHTFAFKDPALGSVALNAGAGQTSAVNFIAPTKKGEYAFRCDLPGHEDNGEVGTMIVK